MGGHQQPHVCGAMGNQSPWWPCDACEVVMDQRERDESRAFEAGLSLSIQDDPLAISALLDDAQHERERLHKERYELLCALAEVFGADVWAVDFAGLLTLIRRHAQNG
jgi:hypothetical protein